MSRIDEIKKRLSLASPGEWVFDPNRHTGDSCIYVSGSEKCGNYIGLDDGGVIGSSEWIWIRNEDGDFISHAKSDIEFLLNELEKK